MRFTHLQRRFYHFCTPLLGCILACFVWVIHNRAQAQFNVYHPFPSDGAVWGMESFCVDISCGDLAYVQNFIAGDTIIDGLNYKKIQEVYADMTGNMCCFPPGDDGMGYLREDTAARKVYWRNMQTGAESLLYDFTLNVGDPLQGFLFDCNPGSSSVVSVDSILVGSSYRRRINIDTTETCRSFSLIEGIGSTTGLTGCFFSPFAQIGTELVCFTEGGEVLYNAPCGPPNVLPCGTLPVAVENAYPSGLTVLVVSPNPASDIVFIGAGGTVSPFVVSVFDMYGNELLREDVAASRPSIDVSRLASGTYFIKTQDATSCSFGKLMKR